MGFKMVGQPVVFPIPGQGAVDVGDFQVSKPDGGQPAASDFRRVEQAVDVGSHHPVVPGRAAVGILDEMAVLLHHLEERAAGASLGPSHVDFVAEAFGPVPAEPGAGGGFRGLENGFHREQVQSVGGAGRAFQPFGIVDVPPTAQFRFRFERPLDFSTLSGAVALYDEFGSEIDVARVNQFDKNDDGYLYFEPAAPLAPGAVHYLVIDESLLDDDGAPLCDAIDYSFATENIVASGGTLAADFESPIYWKDPLLAEGSRDLVESGVALSIDTTREREGYGCLRVSYETESDTAVCVVALKNPVAVGASARFGVSVFGDASGNDLEARFSNGAGAIERRTLARLDWTGWRHVHAAIDDLPAGDWSWESLAIARNAAGADSGVVRFDDAGFDAVVSTNEESGVAIPNDYRLDQNYPNPFNPSTTFAFALPEAGYATLDVFNALGERVAVLFEGEARAGTTTLSRSFVDLPSGVYFYRLRAGEFAKTRKMILLK